MNVILLLDRAQLWRHDAAGTSVVQRHIDAISASRCVQRLVVSADPAWADDQQFYKIPYFSMPGTKLRSSLRYSSTPADEQIYDTMKEMSWESALVLGSFAPYMFTFMIDELFSGIPNKEYGLRLTSWADAVRGGLLAEFNKGSSKIQVTQENMYHAYSEIIKGAAWEEVMEELNGEQGPVSI